MCVADMHHIIKANMNIRIERNMAKVHITMTQMTTIIGGNQTLRATKGTLSIKPLVVST